MAKLEKATAPVNTTDPMAKAIQDALSRIKEVGIQEGKTIVDSISKEDWEKWDASGEKALVADQDGFESADTGAKEA